MIYYVPIEPYETRYTADWIEQFEREFNSKHIKFKTVLGDSTTNIISYGTVLDACGTHIYKFSQLKKIIEMIQCHTIKDDDIIFFADLWFPGIESLFYIRNIMKINFKVCGIFHAGTYDSHDFTCREGMREWGKFLEVSWFSEIDLIFLATDFHKDLLLKNSIEFDSSNIRVTGIPFYGEELFNKYCKSVEKQSPPILVFPHRLEKEKHPELFDSLVYILRSKNINFVPVKSLETTHSRDEYFNLLSKSSVMVSFAEQETFGYSTLEAMALGNHVVVPDALSYRETVPRAYRYKDFSEAVSMVEKALKNRCVVKYDCIDMWSNSVSNMLYYMCEKGWKVFR